ncbi:hypothetical protein ARMGADRAFT_1004585 [Armillaria gallica]|uniref:Uncharacterized protein n=1 Tax=Armillaria gallica TaxID=47427 RepID=A0A2H3EL14_ARMGA|nr:hypothetical protein ARMGADRAFT_1004585 [Armillaria gallica]
MSLKIPAQGSTSHPSPLHLYSTTTFTSPQFRSLLAFTFTPDRDIPALRIPSFSYSWYCQQKRLFHQRV